MKLASYINDGKESYGIVTDDGGVIDLASRLGDELPTLLSLVEAGFGPAQEIAATESADLTLDSLELLPPIPKPGAIWCAGLNTHSHFDEVAGLFGLKDLPEYPIMFLRNSNTVVGSGQPMEKPRLEPSFDYEGEIAIIIGQRCRHVPVEEATNYIAAYSCFNEGSARQYQMRSRQGTSGKNAYRSGGFGPYLVTADEAPVDNFHLETRVNGEVRQSMDLDDLIFGFAELISYMSEFTWLEPGDVIATGSAEGNGVLRKPVGTLEVGDVVEVEVTGLGVLTNPVIEEQS